METVSSGWEPLDRLLPGGGLRPGSLVEWLGDGPGSGAGSLALGAAREACRGGGVLVVIDRLGQVYPPALAAWGWDLSRLIFVHPSSLRDEAWAWDQSLACPSVAAVWGELERIDDRRFRRWQLSAESSGVLGLLVRPAALRQQPSWADLRLLVHPRPGRNGRRLHVQLVRCRGAAEGGVEFELDEWTGRVQDVARESAQQAAQDASHEFTSPRDRSPARALAARLAHPALVSRVAGAGRASLGAG